MYILGISAYYHDSAACLLKDGEIICAAQEERFTRLKHDSSFPVKAIEFCLSSKNLDIDKIDYLIFYDKPLLKFERLLETILAFAPRGLRFFLKAIPAQVRNKIWIREKVKRELGYKGEILFSEHHLSHAASAFFPSPFERAAILTIDGVGEWATASYGIGAGSKIKILKELYFPHSLGLLYSAFTYYLGFRVNSGEYKMMGLAPYGKPKYVKEILNNLVDLKEDGSFRMNMKYFNYGAGLTMVNNKFCQLFNGPVRKPEDGLTARHTDIACSIQQVAEEIILRMVKQVKKETGEKKLCLAGGVALNCAANGKILQSKIFDKIWIQPAAGDAGGALGAAYIAYCHYLDGHLLKKDNKDLQKGSYLGPEYDNNCIKEFLDKQKIVYSYFKEEDLLNKAADYIMEQKVIGWFQGKMEFGPRALGNRSIIADARSLGMQKKLNLKIKFRESFRPFAPSVLAEKANEWFDIINESPYMLLITKVKKNKLRILTEEESSLSGLDKLEVVRSEIPAVTHVDYTARPQTVNKSDNYLYYSLIEKFYKKTGCPVIINTSFNVRGEPIVATPQDAFKCFIKTNMDVLVLGNFIIKKSDVK